MKSKLQLSRFRRVRRRPFPLCLLLVLAVSSLCVQQGLGQDGRPRTPVPGFDALFEEARALSREGTLEARREAIEKYEAAARLANGLSDYKAEAEALRLSGTILNSIDERQRALETLGRAREAGKKAGDRESEASVLDVIGTVQASSNNYRLSLAAYLEALEISRTLGNVDREALIEYSICGVYIRANEYRKALEHCGASRAIASANKNETLESLVLTRIGDIHRGAGQLEKAVEVLLLALEASEDGVDRRNHVYVLSLLAGIHRTCGDYATALLYADKSVELARASRDPQGLGRGLGDMARIYHFKGDYARSLEIARQALVQMRLIGNKTGEAAVLNGISESYGKLGEITRALEYLHLSMALLRGAESSRELGTKMERAAELWKLAGNRRMAIVAAKQSVNQFQLLRGRIQNLDDEVGREYLKSVEGAYRLLFDLLAGENRLAEAVQLVRMFKDQQYFDFNHYNEGDLPRIPLTPGEQEIAGRFDGVYEAFIRAGRDSEALRRRVGRRSPTEQEAARLRELSSESDAAAESLKSLVAAGLDTNGGPAADSLASTPEADELQRTLAGLDSAGKRTVAILTVVGDDKFRTLLVTADRIRAFSSPVKGEMLNARALRLWRLLQSDRYDPRPLSRELYDIVFKPVEASLPPGTTNLMWNLDGNLRYVPVAALYDGRRFLAERFEHSVFTRSERERLTRTPSHSANAAGFGGSRAASLEVAGEQVVFGPLPGVEAELGGLFGGPLRGIVLRDGGFTRESMLGTLRSERPPVVHIASHFAFRPGDSSRSFLLLGDGSPLTLSDLRAERGLFEGVELLTLSACSTAAQQPGADGREIDAFAELAQRLGADSVMAALWQVSDVSTPHLMRGFYATRGGTRPISKTGALRQAQAELIRGTARLRTPQGSGAVRADLVESDVKDAPPYKRNPKAPYAHPFYWAPFVIIGNWK